MFVLNVSLVTRVLLWSVYRSRLICICVEEFTNCITFWSSFSTWTSCIKFDCRSLKWARFGTVVACENIRFSSLFVDGDVSPGAKSEEKRMFSQARTDRRWPWLLPTSEFLFWFKVESCGFSCHAFIGFLMGLFIPLWLSTGNSFKSLGKAFV